MTVIITRHDFSADDAGGWCDLLHEGAIEAIDGLEESPRNFDQAFLMTLTEAEARCLRDPLAEYSPTWRAWVAAMEVGSALFASATASGDRIEARIAGKTRSIPFSGPQYSANAGNWLKAFWLAVICREQERMAQLCTVPLSLLRESGAEYDEYIYDWVDTLQSYWLNRGNVSEKLVAAVDGTKPESAEIATPDLMLKVLYPPIELFYRYLRQDGQQFNSTLADAVRWHKEFWTADDDHASSSEGLVALAPLALACLGHDAEFPAEVRSDYLPHALVEGAWVGELDT